MLKKLLTLLCLAAFVGSMAACGGSGGTPKVEAGKVTDKTKQLTDNPDAATAEVY